MVGEHGKPARQEFPAYTNARPGLLTIEELTPSTYAAMCDRIDTLTAQAVMSESERAAAIWNLTNRVDTLTAENRLMRALLKVPGASDMRKIDGWYWCTADAEFVSAARRCSGADPTLCSLVTVYTTAPREEGKQ